jgi:ABC-type sugar transport system substrate-binding protein
MFNPLRHPIKLLPALAATAAVAAAAAPAASAAGTTYCVNDPSCGGTVEPTLQRALNKARNHLGDDTVQIGAGRYSRAGGFRSPTAP